MLVLLGCGSVQSNEVDALLDGPGDDASLDAAEDAMVRVFGQKAYIKASDPAADDKFGFRTVVSADGSTLVVSAFYEASAATGIGGNQADTSAPGSGAVYVFTRSGMTWAQQAYIKASNTGTSDLFGCSIALSADGSTLAVGAPWEDSAATGIGSNQGDNSAPNAGAVYIFTRSGTAWGQQAYVKASNTGANDQFGAVALSADGSTLVVGAHLEDSAATGVGGNQADNSIVDSGAAYVFVRNGTSWTQQAYLKASNPGAMDIFGYTVALSGDGSTMVVSAHGEDSGANGINGSQTDNSTTNAGAAYVFTRSGASWNQQAYVKTTNPDVSDLFGNHLALSYDGSLLAASAYVEDSAAIGIGGNQADNSATNSGAVYVFARTGTTWSQEAYVKASNSDADDEFGSSVALSGDGTTLAVGATGEDSAAIGVGGNESDNSVTEGGAAYLFTRVGTVWSQRDYVKASNTGMEDWFGNGVSLSHDGSLLVVSSYGEDSATSGIDGDQTDSGASDAGAVYVFE